MYISVKGENHLGCYIVSICKLPTSRSFIVFNFQVRPPHTFVVIFSPSKKSMGYKLKRL